MEFVKRHKGLVVLGVVVLVVLCLAGSLVGTYNTMATRKEGISNMKSEIQVMLQRRADLIPQLMGTVKGAVGSETKYMTDVIEARSGLTKAIDTSDMQQMANANKDMTDKLQIMVNALHEQYPSFTSSTQFTSLFDEIAGTQNRITVAQTNYNTSVRSYNDYLVRFPNNIFAGMFGFSKETYFEATSPNVEQAPVIDFGY